MPATSRKNDDGRFVLISRATLIALFDNAVRSKMLAELLAKSTTGRKARWASTAAAVSACVDLGKGDLLAAHSHDSLPAFVAGQSAARVVAALRRPGPAERTRFEKRLSGALIAARKNAKRSNGKVVVVFRGTASEHAWETLLTTALAENLPMILLANGDLENVPGKNVPVGMPTMVVDRDDVVAIYRVTAEGMTHARRGNGPTLVECIPWNLDGSAAPTDTIAALEGYLAKKGIAAARRRVKVAGEFEPRLARLKSARK